LLPAGAVAGWGLHPLESAAFPRRTPEADLGLNRPTVLKVTRKALANAAVFAKIGLSRRPLACRPQLAQRQRWRLQDPERLDIIGARTGDREMNVLLQQSGRGAAEHHKTERVPELGLQCQDVLRW